MSLNLWIDGKSGILVWDMKSGGSLYGVESHICGLLSQIQFNASQSSTIAVMASYNIRDT